MKSKIQPIEDQMFNYMTGKLIRKFYIYLNCHSDYYSYYYDASVEISESTDLALTAKCSKCDFSF